MVDDFDAKITRLLEDLTKATIEGRIVWTETVDVREFRTKLKNSMIRIGHCYFYDNEGNERAGYSIALLGRDGNVVEVFEVEPKQSPEVFEIARNLYEIVRRNARRVDQFLDQVLAELEDRSI